MQRELNVFHFCNKILYSVKCTLKKKLVLAEPTCPLMVFPFKLVVYLLTSLTLIGTASYLTVKVLQQKDPCTPLKCGLFWVHLYRMVTLLYLFLLGTSGPKTAHVPPSPPEPYTRNSHTAGTVIKNGKTTVHGSRQRQIMIIKVPNIQRLKDTEMNK